MDTITTLPAPVVTVMQKALWRKFVIKRLVIVSAKKDMGETVVTNVRMGGMATLNASHASALVKDPPQLMAYVTPPLVSAPARSTTEDASVISAHQGITTILTALLVIVTALGLMGCLALIPVLVTVKRILLVKSVTNVPQQDSIILCVKSAIVTQTV